MSNAVATTGIAVRRSTGAAPTAKTITSSAIGTQGVITTSTSHTFVTGDVVTIAGHTGSVPAIDGTYRVTVLSATTFSIPVNVTTGGTGGTAQGPKPMETVGEILSVTPPGYSRNKIDTTTHNDGAESSILGILRQRDVTFRINYVGSDLTHQHIVSDMLTNPSPKNTWQIVFPSGILYQGDARVSTFNLADAPVDGAQQADVTLAWASPIVGYSLT